MLDAEWVEDLYDELGWISLESAPSDSEGRERLAARLHSERYLTVLERLVGAVRAPKLAEVRVEPTGEVLTELIGTSVARLRHAANALTTQSEADEWTEAWQEMGRLHLVLDAAAEVLPDEPARLERMLESASRLLAQVHDDRTSESTALLMVAEMTPEAAFLAGRDFERETDKARRTRRDFVREWSKVAKKLSG